MAPQDVGMAKRGSKIAGLWGALLLATGAPGVGAAPPGGTLLWTDPGMAAAPLMQASPRPFISARSGGLLRRPAAPLIGGSVRQRAPARERTPARLPPLRLDAEAAALVAAPPASFAGLGALGCIAVSIYHEARNQPATGQYAVGSVILTRAATPGRWGDTACAVVQPVQFSYLTPDRQFAPITEPEAWALAVRIAAQVLRDGPSPALQGADHYHATYVWPAWNERMTAVGRIADHVFWRSVPDG